MICMSGDMEDGMNGMNDLLFGCCVCPGVDNKMFLDAILCKIMLISSESESLSSNHCNMAAGLCHLLIKVN